MGKLSKPDIFEAAFWLLLAVIFFAVSFSFNQPIEIYKFGATGWPRVILFLMALIALGNFYHAYSKGSKAQEGRVGAKENDDPIEYTSMGQYIKTGTILVLPLLYGLSLKPVGFYSGTPNLSILTPGIAPKSIPPNTPKMKIPIVKGSPKSVAVPAKKFSIMTNHQNI